MSNYNKKIVKIYFWQILSFLLYFCSMFIVTPLTTSMPEIYGIYTVCVSLNIFLSYADLGFISAGQKYASEFYAKGDYENEKCFVNSSMFIYTVICLLFLCAAVFFALHPQTIISDLRSDSTYFETAQDLLWVFAGSIIISVFSKIGTVIFSIRLEDYVPQRINIIGSVIRIISVPLYFFNKRYDIVGYYAFCQIVTFMCSIIVLVRSNIIGYEFRDFVKLFRPSIPSLKIMYPLALSGFVASIGWVLYYELDNIAISSLLGAKLVAVYAIGRSIQSFIRTLMSIIYSPFQVRFNYFIGKGQTKEMTTYFCKIVRLLSPVVVVPVLTVILFAEPFVIAWVGPMYNDSIIIMQLLVSCFLLNYITSPLGSILYALNRVRDIIVVNLINPIFFWVGITLTINSMGVNSFAFFKLISCIISALYSIIVARRVLSISYRKFVYELSIKQLFAPCLVCVFLFAVSKSFLCVQDKSASGLFIVVCAMAVVVTVSLLAHFFINKEFYSFVKDNLAVMFNNK